MGIDRTTYTLYENGVTNPSIEALAKLSSVYNATIGYILGKEENYPERIVTEGKFLMEDNLDPVAFLPKRKEH